MLFNWLNEAGVKKIFELIDLAMNILRYAVPIGLIVMTSIDIFKKVINPDDKDGQKKILNRAIAAILVFFAPTIVNLVMGLIGLGIDNKEDKSSSNPSSVIDNKSSKISAISINCPSDTFNIGDKVNISATGNNNYQGDFNFKIINGREHATLSNSSGKSTSVEISSYPNMGIITIQVSSSNNEVRDTCSIHVQNKISNLSINCPTKTFEVGDKVNLSVTGDNNYQGEFQFRLIDGLSAGKLDSMQGKMTTLNILSYPANGIVTVEASADGIKNYCSIKVKEDTVNIINCPIDKVYKKGDSLSLSAKTLRNGEVKWYTSSDNFVSQSITNNGYTNQIILLDYVPTGQITISASSNGGINHCTIKVHPSENVSGDFLLNNCPFERVKVGNSFVLESPYSIENWVIAWDSYLEIVNQTDKQLTVKVIKHFSNDMRLNILGRTHDLKDGYCWIYTAP